MGEELSSDIGKIINTPNPRTAALGYSAILYNVDKNEEVNIDLLKEVTFERNYNTDYMEIINIDFNLAGDDYARVVGGDGDRLEIAITESVDGIDEPYERSKRYIFLLSSNMENRDTNYTRNMSNNEQGKHTVMPVQGQCCDPVTSGMKAAYSDKVFKGHNVMDIIKREIKEQSGKIKVEGKPLNISIDAYDKFNTTSYDNIHIPTGTRTIDLPGYFQKGKYGVYPGGVGSFIQYSWKEERYINYVYPLYSEDRVEEEKRKLIVYYPSDPKMATAKNTWMIDGDLTKIIAAEVKSNNPGRNRAIANGTEVVKSKPEDSLTIGTNKRSLEGADKGKELTSDPTNRMSGSSSKSTKSGLGGRQTYIKNTSNDLNAGMDYILQNMIDVTVTWRYSDMDIIYPGMPVKFISTDNRYGVIEQNGTVQVIYSSYNATYKKMDSFLILKVSMPTYEEEETYT